jgi:hypothetical protein
VYFLGLSLRGGGDDGKKAQTKIDLSPDPQKCKEQPAGHLIEQDGKQACVYLYDEEMRPMKNVDVQSLTPSGNVKLEDGRTIKPSSVKK